MTHTIEPNKYLLLPNSVIFNNSRLLDNIHQSIIDLKLDPPKEHIKELIKEKLSYLDNNLNKEELDELIIFNFSCLLKFHNHEDQFFEDIYNNSCKNRNRLILFAQTLIKINTFINCDGY